MRQPVKYALVCATPPLAAAILLAVWVGVLVAEEPPAPSLQYRDLPPTAAPAEWRHDARQSSDDWQHAYHYHVNPRDCKMFMSQASNGTSSLHHIILSCEGILQYPGAEPRYDPPANYTYVDDDMHSCYFDIRYSNYTEPALPDSELWVYMDCYGDLD